MGHVRPAHRPCKSALTLYQSLVFLAGNTMCGNFSSRRNLVQWPEMACITKNAIRKQKLGSADDRL